MAAISSIHSRLNQSLIRNTLVKMSLDPETNSTVLIVTIDNAITIEIADDGKETTLTTYAPVTSQFDAVDKIGATENLRVFYAHKKVVEIVDHYTEFKTQNKFAAHLYRCFYVATKEQIKKLNNYFRRFGYRDLSGFIAVILESDNVLFDVFIQINGIVVPRPAPVLKYTFSFHNIVPFNFGYRSKQELHAVWNALGFKPNDLQTQMENSNALFHIKFSFEV